MVLAEDRGERRALLLYSHTHTDIVQRTTVLEVSLVAVEATRVARESVHDGVGGGEKA